VTAGPGWETAYTTSSDSLDPDLDVHVSAPGFDRPGTANPHGCEHPVTQTTAPCRWAVATCFDEHLNPYLGACHGDAADNHSWAGVVKGKFKFNGWPGHDGGAAWVPDYMLNDPANQTGCSARNLFRLIPQIDVHCRAGTPFWRGGNPGCSASRICAPYHTKNSPSLELTGVIDVTDWDCAIDPTIPLGVCAPIPTRAFALRVHVYGDGYVTHTLVAYWGGN
jgi:hypothetical protein